MPLPLRAILIRSPRAEMEPWAQQLPQYCGMCWLRDMVHRPWSHHEKESGRSSDLSVSCGSGESVWLPRHTMPFFSVVARSHTSEGRPLGAEVRASADVTMLRATIVLAQ